MQYLCQTEEGEGIQSSNPPLPVSRSNLTLLHLLRSAEDVTYPAYSTLLYGLPLYFSIFNLQTIQVIYIRRQGFANFHFANRSQNARMQHSRYDRDLTWPNKL